MFWIYFEDSSKWIGFPEGIGIILKEMRAKHKISGLSNQRRKKIRSQVLDPCGVGCLLDIHFEGTGGQVAESV